MLLTLVKSRTFDTGGGGFRIFLEFSKLDPLFETTAPLVEVIEPHLIIKSFAHVGLRTSYSSRLTPAHRGDRNSKEKNRSGWCRDRKVVRVPSTHRREHVTQRADYAFRLYVQDRSY